MEKNLEGDEQMKKEEEFHGAFLRKKHQWRRGVRKAFSATSADSFELVEP